MIRESEARGVAVTVEDLSTTGAVHEMSTTSEVFYKRLPSGSAAPTQSSSVAVP
jgi:hypothetical protein